MNAVAQRLFGEWSDLTGRKRARPTPDRLTKIIARLREGYSEEEIRRAIRNVASSEWHRGQNDHGKEYIELSMICRSGEKLEHYRDMDDVTAPVATWEHQAEAALASGRIDDYERLNAHRNGGGVGEHVEKDQGRPEKPRGIPAGGGAVPPVLRLAGIPRKTSDGAG
jgi:hypothetical protein